MISIILHTVNSDPRSSTPPPPPDHAHHHHHQAPPTDPSPPQPHTSTAPLRPRPPQTAGSALPIPPPSLVATTSSGSHVPPPTPSLGVGGQTRGPQEAKVDTILWGSNRMMSGDPGVKGHHGGVNRNAVVSPTGGKVHQGNGMASSLGGGASLSSSQHRHYRFSIDLRSLQDVALEPGVKCYLRYALVSVCACPLSRKTCQIITQPILCQFCL